MRDAGKTPTARSIRPAAHGEPRKVRKLALRIANRSERHIPVAPVTEWGDERDDKALEARHEDDERCHVCHTWMPSHRMFQVAVFGCWCCEVRSDWHYYCPACIRPPVTGETQSAPLTTRPRLSKSNPSHRRPA